MSRNNKMTATLAGILAALAFGGSTAAAMPLQGPQEHGAGHASIALRHAAAASLAQEQAQTQASAQDILKAQGVTARADLRSPDTREAAINSGVAKQPVLQGAPQFPTAVASSLHSTQPPVNDDDGVPVLTIILGAFGALLIGAGAAFAVVKTTRSRRVAA